MSESTVEKIKELLKDLDDDERSIIRDQIVITQTGDRDPDLSSADISADDEKKKYIAQHGNPNAQTRAQDVPEPESDELKSEQNLASMEQNRAKPLDDQTKAHVLGEDRSDT